MTAVDERPAVITVAERAQSRIDDAIEGLRKLRGLVAEQPAVAASVVQDLAPERSPAVLVYVDTYNTGGVDVPEFIASVGAAAGLHGGDVTLHDNDRFAGLDAQFGFVKLHVYADLDRVGVVGASFTPHPVLAVFDAAVSS